MISQVTYMYYTGRLEVFNENFPAVSYLNLNLYSTISIWVGMCLIQLKICINTF